MKGSHTQDDFLQERNADLPLLSRFWRYVTGKLLNDNWKQGVVSAQQMSHVNKQKKVICQESNLLSKCSHLKGIWKPQSKPVQLVFIWKPSVLKDWKRRYSLEQYQ